MVPVRVLCPLHQRQSHPGLSARLRRGRQPALFGRRLQTAGLQRWWHLEWPERLDARILLRGRVRLLCRSHPTQPAGDRPGRDEFRDGQQRQFWSRRHRPLLVFLSAPDPQRHVAGSVGWRHASADVHRRPSRGSEHAHQGLAHPGGPGGNRSRTSDTGVSAFCLD